jgi:Cu+-exporting ATPase
LLCAIWGRTWVTGAALASFAGIAAASFVVVCAAMFRATEPVAASRSSILAALDVLAKTNAGTVLAADVRAGELVNVAAGDTVPVDGVVVAGEAVVSPWLDATTDVTKREGSSVVAGARVLSGTLSVTATWTGADRAFAKLLTLSKAGGFGVAPLVKLATLLDGRVIVPFCVLAGGMAFANGATVIDSIACAAASLTAFGTPIATFAVSLCHTRAHLRALQKGIVHRDARHFDRAGRARIAVVCARGTVLLGEPEIVAIEAIGANDATAIIALASAVVMGSPHPFAAAIVRAARARGVRPENVRNPVHAGSGAIAVDAQGERIVVGRRVFLLTERVSMAVADTLVRDHEAQGRSVLLVSRGGKVVGLVALQDGLRAGARAAIQKLHDARIEPVLLSGEARETCEAIGRALDIEHLRPEVAGAERGAEVRALAEGGDVVAVLGHPAADDSALSAADVSVALDAAGASPGEWAVALASDDVRAAAEALTVARVARERSIRAMVVAFAPGIIASLGLAFQLVPFWVAPLVGALSATMTLLYAKE